MVNLASESVAIRIDPRHGGEVIDLIDLRSGRQLLGRPPFASDEPVSGELDEATWTRSYRGGWQLLVPNAGNPCVVDGVAHGFHGRASTDPWDVVAVGADTAELAWTGHGLRVQRSFSLQGDSVSVRSSVVAEQATALVWVEHIGLGIELLDPSVEIELPGGLAYEVSEQSGPARPPADAPSWPDARLLDGTLERADRAMLTTPRSRLLIVADVPEGRVVVRNRDRRQGIEITWDAAVAAAPVDVARGANQRRSVAGAGRDAGRRAGLGSAHARPRDGARARPGPRARSRAAREHRDRRAPAARGRRMSAVPR